MSITSNKFKSTTIYGNFSNVDDKVSNIQANSFFSGSVTISGNLSLPDYPSVYSTLSSHTNSINGILSKNYVSLSSVIFYNTQTNNYVNGNFISYPILYQTCQIIYRSQLHRINM